MIKAIANSLLSIAFPQQCHVCRGPVEARSDGVACAACWSVTRVFEPDSPSCPKCCNLINAAPVSFGARCHECADHLYDQASAGGIYERALAAVVIDLKTTPNLPKHAGDLLISAFERLSVSGHDLIVPVPLASKRLAERGFNQAEVIGQFLAKRTGVPTDAHTLERTKHTPMHRAAMDRKAREATVKNAFRVTRPNLIQGKNVLLVDDIFTTGATASYCAKELKKNGAALVNVVTLARAVKNHP